MTIRAVSDELWGILQQRIQEEVDTQDAITTGFRGF